MKLETAISAASDVPASSGHILLVSDEELDVFLNETITSECRADIVFNQSASPYLVDAFYRYGDMPEYTALFVQTAYAPLARKSPWFFELSMNNPFLDALKRIPCSWGFLAVGCLDQETGLTHWKSLLNALLPDDTITHFRFYSSGVLLQTAKACSDNELMWLLGPYSHLVLPVANAKDTPWAIIYHPGIKNRSSLQIALDYRLRNPVVWWQVSQSHLDAFQETLDKVYTQNLVVWLWENHSKETEALYSDGADIYAFLSEMIINMRHWGFDTPERQTRCLAALLPSLTNKESAASEKHILEKAKADPDNALKQLEILAAHRRQSCPQ